MDGSSRRGRSRSSRRWREPDRHRLGRRRPGNLCKALTSRLRHEVRLAGAMSLEGWVPLTAVQALLPDASKNDLLRTVRESRDRLRSRTHDNVLQVAAINGHSIPGIIGLSETLPLDSIPELLWHGCRMRLGSRRQAEFSASVRAHGLRPENRPVHMTTPGVKWNKGYSLKVTIRAKDLLSDKQGEGWTFRKHLNGAIVVWGPNNRLVPIPPEYVTSIVPWIEADGKAPDEEEVSPTGEPSPTSQPEISSQAAASSSAPARLPTMETIEVGASDEEQLASPTPPCLGLPSYLAPSDSEEDAPRRNVQDVDIEALSAALSWRREKGFLDDADFAFAFTSREQAAKISQELADQWTITRKIEMKVAAAGAHKVIAACRAAAAPQLAGIGNLPPRPSMYKGPPKGLLAKEPDEARIQSKKRDVLESLVREVKKLPTHPWVSRAVSQNLSKTEFEQFLASRIAQLNRFELRTLRSAELALARLQAHFPYISVLSSSMRIESYLASLKNPAATFHALKWLETHMAFPLCMREVYPPERRHSCAVGTGAKQCMLQLGAEVTQLYRQGDPRWIAGIVAHVDATGTMRNRHVQRSVLVSITTEVATFLCAKGKTGDRSAYSWSCPVKTLDGHSIMVHCWYDMLQKLAERSIKPLCVAFDPSDGRPLAYSALTKAWRSIYSEGLEVGQDKLLVDNAQLVTSYSFRRVAPTLANAIQLPWPLRLSLGAWQESPGGSQHEGASLMPARYAGNRDDIQACTKLAVQAVLRDLVNGGMKTWQSARVFLSKVDVSAYLQRAAEQIDGSTKIWESPDKANTECFLVRSAPVEHSSEESVDTPSGDDFEKSEPPVQIEAPSRALLVGPVEAERQAQHTEDVFFSASTHKVHLHKAAWASDDFQAIPACKFRHAMAKPLRRPIAIGKGLTQAKTFGELCRDCVSVLRLTELV